MLNALRNLFSGESAPPDQVLLTRRIDDPAEHVQGFDEIYFCKTCGDYFVLAWHQRSSPLAKVCSVVECKGRSQIFCPVCGEDYRMYGPILGLGVRTANPDDVKVFDSFVFPFPPESTESANGLIKVGDITIERIVLLVTGEFPPVFEVRRFAYSGASRILRSLRGELSVSEHGGIRIHVLRTDCVSDETSWLTPVLKKHVYKLSSWGTRTFLAYGPLELEPPLRQAVFCLMYPPPAG
jgi:hypothetical protein